MNDKQINMLIQNRAKKKFYGHKKLYSKYAPQIPLTAERELVRLMRSYISGILRSELEEKLPKIKEIYKKERDLRTRGFRKDDETDFMIAVAAVMTEIQNGITAKTEGFGLRKKLEVMAQLNRKLTIKEWKKACKATLGINILEDYYLDDFYAEGMQQWVEYNVDLIKTIPQEYFDKIREVIDTGYIEGRTTTEISKEIRKIYGVSKRRADFIARDQCAKLNGQISRAQQVDAGLNEYIWSDSGDSRVRASHRALNGHKFSWDEPPENADGRCCHPGEDYGCRCVAIPVFEYDYINLPIDTSEEVDYIES